MSRKIAGFFFIAVMINAVNLNGLPLERLVDSSQVVQLRSGEKKSGVQFGSPKPGFIPNHAQTREVVESIRKSLNPGIMAERLQLYAKPEGSDSWTQQEQLAIFKSITAMSSLEGLQYFSASRNEYRTFYEKSCVIDGPSTKKALQDPNFRTLPAEYSLYALQKDLTFGDNIYRYDYRTGPDSLIFVQQNITSMTYGFITAVGKNNLHSVLAVIDTGDGLLLYAVSMAKATAIPGIKDRIGNSFSNRAEAVMTWFAKQADGVYK